MFSKKGSEASCHRASGKTRVKPELSTVGIKRYFALKVYSQSVDENSFSNNFIEWLQILMNYNHTNLVMCSKVGFNFTIYSRFFANLVT